VLRGEVDVELLVGRRISKTKLRAGEFAIVPRGRWHRPIARGAVQMLHVTPSAGTRATFENLPPPLTTTRKRKAR
jgi:quercetin dioxygenase-like cupin family protein